ncbi:MAG: T9SS type A sorting domain-containing protein [Prevotellaceae bacterium]|jgi:hypothetical protein|nr:T9SS type A sorting domain-containing protein [Prevotellaceae bacterium]
MQKITKLIMLAISIFAVQSVMGLTYNVTVPAGTNAVYITGDAVGGWGTWVKMTKTDATHFTVELANATAAQEYKYYSGPDWVYEEAVDAQGTGRGDGNNRRWSDNSGVDIVPFWKEVFVPDVTTVTIELWTQTTVYQIYLAGNFSIPAWDGAFPETNKMTYVGEEDGGKVFSYQITTENPAGLEFKFVAGNSWDFEQLATSNWTLATAVSHSENTYSYVMQFADFKAVLNPDLMGIIIINATVPETEEVYIQGSLFGWGWSNPEAMKMTKVDATHFTYTTSAPYQAFEYRLYNPVEADITNWDDAWGYPEEEYLEDTNNPGTFIWKDKPNRSAVYVERSTYNITVCKWKNDDGGTLCEQEPMAVQVINNDYYTVVSDNGVISVTNAKSGIEIYDVMGRMLESSRLCGDFTSKTLRTGLYLVRVDGNTEKVVVK